MPGAPACQSLCSSPGRPPEAQTSDHAAAERALHGADHLRIRGQRALVGVGARVRRLSASRPCRLSRVAVHAAGAFQPPSLPSSSSSPARASATSGRARCLPASKTCVLSPMIVLPSVLEQRPRAGGEILQPRADRQHHVGLFGEQVGGRRAGDADRSPCSADGRAAGATCRPGFRTTGMPCASANFASVGGRLRNRARRRRR